jgi:putative hemolysin
MYILKIVVLALAVLAAPALAVDEGAADSVGIADPSCVYCEALGYECQDGDCVFPDGTSCPTWDFYRGKCGQNFTYCGTQGYKIENRMEDMGTWTAEHAVCVFDDCSECDEQTYFDGNCQPSECSRWTLEDGCKPAIEFEGLISKVARINNSAGQSAEDVLGWDVIYRDEDGKCYSYYVAQAPLIGMTESVEVDCPLGVQPFDRYMVDFEDAIAVMQSMDCGGTFVELSLSWPLTQEVEEPLWRIRTDIGNEIVVGANCGKAECVAAE